MNTPIKDFLRDYADKGATRLHMPGHKGIGDIERFDLTEVEGADSLYEASGIIKESEENAGRLFGADTLYSTEGSSHVIRAMLYLVSTYAKKCGRSPRVLAGRNAHKTFIGAAALLDVEVEWLIPSDATYLSCNISSESVENRLKSSKDLPTAVYLTSPDYLGKLADVSGIAEVCHRYGVLLIVDNAHGAYLKFLETSLHPIDLGADMCSDSAHKTLPVLTGGAYLHISRSAPTCLFKNAKNSLALFGSTSPSYLILSSLDGANRYIADGYRERLCRFVEKLDGIKKELASYGYELCENEPMKITLMPKAYGYLGSELAKHLTANGIVPEFADPDHLVLMPTPETTDLELDRLLNVLAALDRRAPINEHPPQLTLPERVISPREAILSDSETIPVDRALGQVLAAITVGCPPAVPILVSGERIDENAIKCFNYYGITECSVVSL